MLRKPGEAQALGYVPLIQWTLSSLQCEELWSLQLWITQNINAGNEENYSAQWGGQGEATFVKGGRWETQSILFLLLMELQRQKMYFSNCSSLPRGSNDYSSFQI